MDNRRLILLLIFSFSLIMLWDAWQKQHQPAPAPAAGVSAPATPQPGAELKAATQGVPVAATAAPVAVAPVAGSELITIRTDLFVAEVSTAGGDIVSTEYLNYRATGDASRRFRLFESEHRYAAQSGLIGEGLPNHRTLFQAEAGPREITRDGDGTLTLRLLAPEHNGVRIAKVLTFTRGSYLIDVAYEIDNGSAASLAPHAYFQIQRDNRTPDGESKMVHTFTGPAVFTNEEKFQKIDFADVEKGKAKFKQNADNGWVAMVQHYFVAAWLPQHNGPREFYMRKVDADAAGGITTAAGVILPVEAIPSGGKAKVAVPLYAGPQIQDTLKKLAEGLDLVVDYGWLTVIAAPIFWALEWIHKLVGNWGWAIVLLTVGIKAAFFPLSAASYKSMARMRQVTPRLMALKERYGSDRQKLNQEMMKLYQTEKINPLGGCLPILVQIPVFIALYWALLGAVEMRDAPWILWITDLSANDPYYILPVIMVATMVLQTKLNPTPPDPIQAKVMQYMPYVFGVMFFFFPAGLVLYWVVNNILSIAQQWQITRQIEGAAKP